MTTPAQRSALAALETARPTIARLASEQNSEDRAADLIEGWSAVETALRALLGGSTLTGRALIHELRSRQVISFDQANTLAEFEAARSRAERPTYEPTDADVASARDAFAKLERGLQAAAAAPAAEALDADTATAPPAVASAAWSGAPVTAVDATAGAPAPTPQWQRWMLVAVGSVVVVALGVWLFFRTSGDSSLERGVAFYREGKREQAQAAFERAAREDPKSALPHVYLSRMARDVGNLTLARDEARKAIEADQNHPLALREMGAYLLTSGNYELARRFYVRAVQADTSDRTAKGYLGCVMMRLGRMDEGRRWLERAGPGNWSSCATMAPAPGMPGSPPSGAPVPPPQVP